MKKSRVDLLLLMSVLLICFSIGCKSEPSSAKPQATNYTVTFNANGGSGTMSAQTFAKDETKALSANTFTMTNKVFTGWNTKADGTGTSYTDGQSYTATGNITLYAQWADVAFVVTFDKNDGSGDKVTQPFAAGTPQNLKANTFTIADKFFTGWNTKADGTGTPYTDGQSYTATADITLYAQWRDPNIYTVTFDKNDGSTPSTTATQTFIEGKSQNLTAYGFGDIECGTFNSWNTQADGKGTSFEDEEEYTATATTTLYAQYDFEYLCFTAEEAISTVKLVHTGVTTFPTLEYSTDGFIWNDFGVISAFITLPDVEDKFYLRGSNATFSESGLKYLRFVMTGRIAASGNIMSLLDKTCESKTLLNMDYVFFGLFYECTSLTTAPELPATTLSESCYSRMFYGCTSLTEAPELPATSLRMCCYDSMFYGCTLLTKAPELPATNLNQYCYRNMFYDCISLAEVPELLPADRMNIFCYSHMFYNCKSLTATPKLPAENLASNCYEYMFSGCTSLTEAPELPMTDLIGKDCYFRMFEDCTSLRYIKVHFTMWRYHDASSYTAYETYEWMAQVGSSGLFVCPSSLPQTPRDWNHIPRGWTIRTF